MGPDPGAADRAVRRADHRSVRLQLAGLAVAIVVAAVAAGLLLRELHRGPRVLSAEQAASALGGAGADEAGMPQDFTFLDPPRPLPALRYVDASGKDHALAELKGHPLVLNIWATWCVPCRKEMPALDRLQASLEESGALVVPLSIDGGGLPVVKAFYEEIGIRSLGVYLSPASDAGRLLGVEGVPTTLLVDRNGRETGRKVGAAEWDRPDMVARIRSRLEPQASGASRGGGQ